MTIAFVFTNPRHHLDMMAPVAAELERRGHRCEILSLAELRGFDTPAGIRRAIPLQLRRRDSTAPSKKRNTWSRGRVAQHVAWQVLRLRMRQLLREAEVVVIPNDAVFPYTELAADLHARMIPTVLLQEGIRFPLPDSYDGPGYGASGNACVCAWGDGSRDYFVANHVPAGIVAVTGAPRLDELDPERWRAPAAELIAEHALPSRPIAFLSNPIEIQGYGPKQLKLDMFARFLDEIASTVRAQNIPIIVKNHNHEDPAEFSRVAAGTAIAEHVHVIPTGSVFAAIAASRAAVVLTSTVGLEALMFGVPLGVLEIPGHDFAFDYVQRGAAVPLRFGSLRAGVDELLADRPERRTIATAFVARHLHDRGRARYNVAHAIEGVLHG